MLKMFNLKKTIISILAIILICSTFLFVGCNKSKNESESSSSDSVSQSGLYNPSEEDDKQTLRIDAVKDVELGDTLKLTVYSTNISTKLVWTSSDPSVATVNDDGEITTVSAGQTIITVSAGSLSSSCTLTVYQTQIAPVINLDLDDITIGVGSTFNINVTSVTWKNAEVQVGKLNWAYKNEPQAEDKIVSITPSADGKKVEIKALKSGDAELTVSCSYFNNLGAKTVKVKVVNLETIAIEGLEYVGNDTYLATTYSEVYTKTVGQTTYNYQNAIDFKVTLYKDGEIIEVQPEITINDSTVAKIEDGKIVGLKEGETTITCSYNGIEKIINFVCARPVVDLAEQDSPIIVDCSTSTSLEVPQTFAIQGTVNNVYFSNDLGKSYVEVGSYNDGVVIIDEENLQTSEMGSGILKLSEDNIDYVLSCSIYTMVIDNAEKLNKLSEESKRRNSSADIFDGYFVLGADITLPKNYEFNEVATGIDANGQNGFIGIFDGQGYQIDGLSIKNGGLFATMGESAVVKNVSFTNASVKDSGFISSKGAGSIKNLYIDYRDISVTESCGGFVGTFFVNSINGKASVSNCVVLTTDATYNSYDKSYSKLFVIGGTTNDEGVYSDILVTIKTVIKENYSTNKGGKNLKNSNDNYIVEQNKQAVAEKFTSFAKTWDRSYWELDEVSFPRPIRALSVIEHSWGSLIAGVNATCTTNGVSAYRECQHCFAFAVCDASGNILNVTTNKNDLTILAGHSSLKYENGTLKCNDCSTPCQEFNLNVHDLAGTFVSDNNSIEIDFSSLSLSSVESIKIGNKAIGGYTVDNHKVTIPYASFCISEGRYYFGNQKLSITYNGSNAVDLSILLKTKVIKSANDLQDFGNIALAQSDNSQIVDNTAYKYSGYFELGANIDCNGARYTMVANSSQHVSSTVNGFSGVFDGKGYTISNLLVGADKMWYNGWDDTPDTCYATYSFFGRLDGGKICNINFTGVKLNPMASLLCTSGYGEISNIYAQISRCAIITDIDSTTGTVVAYFPLGLCFANEVNGDLSKVSIHDILVDYVSCEYLGLNKANEFPYGSGLATYDAFGFVDNEKIYNVFGNGASSYLQNCYVVGYPGQAWNNEIQFNAYTDMNIESLGNFNDNMFAIRNNMLLPLFLANVYDELNSLDVTVDKDIAVPGESVKVDLGNAKSFATFVTESDKISYSNGYIHIANDATGKISFKFTLKLANGETIETPNIIIRVFANEGDVFGAEVELWESEEIGAEKLGSAINSSDATAETLGGLPVYMTNGGYGQSIVNTSIVAKNYSELYFAFKTSERVTLSNGDYLTNVITPNVWYIVKLERHLDGSWSIYTKGISDSNYVEFTATSDFFGISATFETMFRTYLWAGENVDNHQVYATDVWGVKSEQYLTVEGLIASLPEVITTANIDDVLSVYNAYQALSEEQQVKVNADKLNTLNNALGQVFALETSTWAGANKVLDSAINDTATKIGTFGNCDIYSKTGLGAGGNGIGNGNIQINDYKEVYFMIKVTYPVSIFSGDWQAPKLEVNKWYAIKLVKGNEHWNVYQREICTDAWTELVLDNYDSLKSTEPVWFNAAFVVVTWDSGVSYDVFATGMWCVGEEAYNKVETLIDSLHSVVTNADTSAVLHAYNEYLALNEEQQAKVNADKLNKLNNALGQVFALEVSTWVDANKVLDNALNDPSTKVGAFGSYDIYSKTGLTTGGNGVGSGNIQINDYKEVYFMIKVTYPVSIFSGDWNAPKLEVNKWYAIKLVKGDEHWSVYQREICADAWVELVLDNYDSLKSTEPVWLNAAFVTVTWDADVSYDVFATGMWCVIEEVEVYNSVEALIDALPNVITNADISAVLHAYNEYHALSDQEKEDVDLDKLEKLNDLYAQVIDLEISAWEVEGLKDTGFNALTNGTSAGTFGNLEVNSLLDSGYEIIANTNIDSNHFEKLYFAYKTDKQVYLSNANGSNINNANTWYFVKLEKQADGSWAISVKALGESNYIALEASDSNFGVGNAKFLEMFRTYTWDGIAYNVYATNVWGQTIVDGEISSWETAGAEKLGSALNSSDALEETLGGLTVYKTNGGYGQSIVNKSIDASNYSALYFAFKATQAITLSNGNGGVNEVTPNTWYFVKLEKQADGTWSISAKKVGDSSYTSFVATAEFFGTNATFETMFRTYLWTSDTYNHEVYATDVWGVTVVGSEISAWENAGAERLGSALNSSDALEETLGGLAVYKTNGGYGQSIVNKSIDASNYSALYFAFKATQQVTLSSGDYQTNVIIPNTWYFVKLEKQADGTWTISAKKVGDVNYTAFVTTSEFFGANATFETMFRTYLWTSDTYNHEVYATDVWGVTVVGGEISAWENAGAEKLGSALNSSGALEETLGGLAVYKTNGGYGQSIVNKSIDASNYSALYFAFKATQQVTLSNGDYDKNVITPNTWYFAKLEKQEDGTWTISVKKVGDSSYTSFVATAEFFGTNATFETMFRTYLWTSDTYNHEVYATDVWGVTVVGSEVSTWENAGAKKLGSALNSSEALEETLGGLTVYKTNGGYGQSIVNTSINASNYTQLHFAFKATQQVTLSNGDYDKNVITPNTWYFVKLEKQEDGTWTISVKKVGDSSYTSFVATADFFGTNATFETMFRTYLWTSDTYNHEVYATDVWGK